MEKRLSKLKNAMDKTIFKDLDFSERHRSAVFQVIGKEEKKEEDVFRAVLQLLVQEKTGVELAKLLRARGIKNFENNEGFLYTTLHRLELKGHLAANWSEEGEKRYQLNRRGKRLLARMEKSAIKQGDLKLWLEVTANE
ncbi:PadR family transcriptional regulator [Sediminibacillus dalangtanensis]|uniref:PadR family transcriptional regulator n=1 Tax=Sediminibacillus dalangtanensis TaxID=2729421 RepID=A0ABX7VPI5_9BACI|nr:PadR family transcriptional regulator [Sediminibacillus dalangtanensis]QTM98759.1 PadR family transcriptional regulator [Sediminibacillus dalangtanensis]